MSPRLRDVVRLVTSSGELRRDSLHELDLSVGVQPQALGLGRGLVDDVVHTDVGRPDGSEPRLGVSAAELVKAARSLCGVVAQPGSDPAQAHIERCSVGALVLVDGSDVGEIDAGPDDDRQSSARGSPATRRWRSDLPRRARRSARSASRADAARNHARRPGRRRHPHAMSATARSSAPERCILKK